MPLVLDASVTVRWRLVDGTEPVVRDSLRSLQDDYAVVPAIWWFEVRNALLIQERHANLSPSDTAAFLLRLEALPIRIEHDLEETHVFALAREHGLTIYDASYLELAVRMRLALATVDRRLAVAAQRAGVALFQPGAP